MLKILGGGVCFLGSFEWKEMPPQFQLSESTATCLRNVSYFSQSWADESGCRKFLDLTVGGKKVWDQNDPEQSAENILSLLGFPGWMSSVGSSLLSDVLTQIGKQLTVLEGTGKTIKVQALYRFIFSHIFRYVSIYFHIFNIPLFICVCTYIHDYIYYTIYIYYIY